MNVNHFGHAKFFLLLDIVPINSALIFMGHMITKETLYKAGEVAWGGGVVGGETQVSFYVPNDSCNYSFPVCLQPKQSCLSWTPLKLIYNLWNNTWPPPRHSSGMWRKSVAQYLKYM